MDIGYKNPIYIIDDFYKDPDAVRKKALSLEYYGFINSPWWVASVERMGDGQTYVHSKGTVHKTQHQKNIFNKLISPEEISSDWHGVEPSGGYNGAFHVRVKKPPPAMEEIHNDCTIIENIHGWSGILYLTPNAPIESGTNFYRCEDTDEMYQMRSVYEGENLYDNNCKNYIKEFTIDNIYNRCILFKAEIFHSASSGFGTTTQVQRPSGYYTMKDGYEIPFPSQFISTPLDYSTARLTQTFWFNVKPLGQSGWTCGTYKDTYENK